jgi:hypothetical protein
LRKLYIGWPANEQLKASAVDSYPKECSGWLIGGRGKDPDTYTVVSVFPFQQADSRNEGGVDTKTTEALCEEFLGDYTIGGFHSHLEGTSFGMSKDDRLACHDIELVVSLKRGKRKKWLFHFQAYCEITPLKWRRMEVIFL